MAMIRALPVYLIFLFAAGGIVFASAQENPEALGEIRVTDPIIAADIDTLNRSVAERKARVEELNRRIDQYKIKIERKQSEQATLQNELDLLSNRIEKTNIDIQAAQEGVAAVSEELAILNAQMGDVEKHLTAQRALVAALLRRLDSFDQDISLQVLFSTDSFSELFDRLQSLENLNGDMLAAVKKAKLAKAHLVLARARQQQKQEELVTLNESLHNSRARLEQESGAKEGLLANTQHSENQFRALLLELKQEQAQTTNEVAALQKQIEEKLQRHYPGISHVLAWPVNQHDRGLSTLFHDITYPFRHLFEHSGVDIPQAQGTVVHAAGPGYIVWVRRGQLYGNYIMMVHSDGIATLYAHLSRTLVQQDQFVNQGDPIGLSGGMVGSLGAGLSTGPHLHFEVRKDGIPVNPLDYLPAWQ